MKSIINVRVKIGNCSYYCRKLLFNTWPDGHLDLPDVQMYSDYLSL